MVGSEGIEPPLGTNQVRHDYKSCGASSYTNCPQIWSERFESNEHFFPGRKPCFHYYTTLASSKELYIHINIYHFNVNIFVV